MFRATSIGAVALMSMVRLMSPTVCWSNVLLPLTTPAQLMRRSTSPTSDLTAAYAALIFSSSATLTLYVNTLPAAPAVFSRSALAAAILASLISQMMSDAAPFSRQMRPMILPIPDAPPVISTFFELILNIISNFRASPQNYTLPPKIQFISTKREQINNF